MSTCSEFTVGDVIMHMNDAGVVCEAPEDDYAPTGCVWAYWRFHGVSLWSDYPLYIEPSKITHHPDAARIFAEYVAAQLLGET